MPRDSFQWRVYLSLIHILKRKFALWIRPSLLEEVDSLYQKDNCASRSEFMEKALQFYIGYLACSHAQDYLAQVIPSTVKGIMDETANRMGRLMLDVYKRQAPENPHAN